MEAVFSGSDIETDQEKCFILMTWCLSQTCFTVKFKAWKPDMDNKEFCVDMKKTKSPTSVVGFCAIKNSNKCPCVVCHSGVGNNSIEWSHCCFCSQEASLFDWLPTQVTSTWGVYVRLRLSMGGQWIKWMLAAPCVIWRPLWETLVTCCVPVGAVAVALLLGAAWPEVSSGHSCPSSPPDLLPRPCGNINMACIQGSET